VLALAPSLHSMYIGQANLVMLGCALFGLAAAAGGRWNRAAGALALATLIKGYPLALALLLGGIYPRKFILRYLAALSLGLLLPFVTHRPAVVAGQYLNWFDHLRDSTEIMRERLRVAGAGVLGLCWLEAWRTADPRRRLTRLGQLYWVWVALFGPATESCTYVVLGPAIAWALIDAYRRPTGPLTRLLLLSSLLLTGPLVTDLAGPWLRNFANEHGSQPIGALLLLAYLLAQTGRHRETVPAQSPPSPAPARSAA
jgi:hypothetical protein